MGDEVLTAEHIVFFFLHNVVRYFGFPKSVIYDQAPNFTSDFWQSL